MYPEWIQEQLDKLPQLPPSARPETAEARIINYLTMRLNRIETKLDRINGRLTGCWPCARTISNKHRPSAPAT